MSDRPNVRTMSRSRTVCVASYRRTASSVANVSSEFTRQAPPPSLTAAALFRLFYIEDRFLSSREQTGIELACDRISIFWWQDLARGVFRGGHVPPPPIVDWVDFLRKKRLCWDCFLYQKYSVDLKYAKNALAAASDPAGGAHDAPPRSPNRLERRTPPPQFPSLSPPLAPRFSRLRRSTTVPPNVKSWLRPSI